MNLTRVRFGLRLLLLAVAVCAFLSLSLRNSGRYYFHDRHENKYAGPGHHFVYVNFEDGTRHGEMLYDPGWIMGRSVKVSDLITILEKRISTRQKASRIRLTKSVDSPAKAAFALELLSKVPEPDKRTFDLCVKFLDDSEPGVIREAAKALARISDIRALPHLRKALHNGVLVDGTLERMMVSFGDPSVIPELIDAMREQEGGRCQDSLAAIEMLSGSSVQDIVRPWWPCNRDTDFPEMKKAMYLWWEQNKHSMLEAPRDYPPRNNDGLIRTTRPWIPGSPRS